MCRLCGKVVSEVSACLYVAERLGVGGSCCIVSQMSLVLRYVKCWLGGGFRLSMLGVDYWCSCESDRLQIAVRCEM